MRGTQSIGQSQTIHLGHFSRISVVDVLVLLPQILFWLLIVL